MQIPILNGIYADSSSNYRTMYPRNLIPVPKKQGISEGYLKPADGINQFAIGKGVPRGTINWNGKLYAVIGNKFCYVNKKGEITELGTIDNSESPVAMDYSFDLLAIASERKLYYFDGTNFTQVNDPDLGDVLDVVWIDGYFMTTDGNYLVVTELTDPTQINNLKYGSSEVNPDAIQGLLTFRGEVYAVNRYTIEVFSNVGGQFFPFQRIDGAMIPLGSVGTNSFCVYGKEVVAIVGGGLNEPISVYFIINGQHTNVSTREIDTILQSYDELTLSSIYVESRLDRQNSFLYIHLPDQTLVYDKNASAAVGEPVWFILTSSIVGKGTYRARYLVWVYEKWISGDITSNKLGYFTDDNSNHYGDENGYEFGTSILYNEGKGIIIHELELMVLAGHVENNTETTIWTSFSTDLETWSMERPRRAGRIGERSIRLNWLQQGNMKNYRIQKFRGTSKAHLAFSRLEARIEPLND